MLNISDTDAQCHQNLHFCDLIHLKKLKFFKFQHCIKSVIESIE